MLVHPSRRIDTPRSLRENSSSGAVVVFARADQTFAPPNLEELLLDELEALAQPRGFLLQTFPRERRRLVLVHHASEIVPGKLAIDPENEQRSIVRRQRVPERGEAALALGAEVRERRGADPHD